MGFPFAPLIKGGPRAYLFLLLQASMFASSTHISLQHPRVAQSYLDVTLPTEDVSLQALSIWHDAREPKGEEPAALPFKEETIFSCPSSEAPADLKKGPTRS